VGDRRGPLLAAVAVGVAILLAIFFLVLPKMNQVNSANDQLDEAVSQQGTLQSQLAALQQAEQDAPQARETIRQVDQAIPPTADQQGMILLLQNAADQSGIDLFSMTPAAPTLDPVTGLTTIDTSVVVNGSYFAITEFVFNIETLPRAAKVGSLQIAPVGEDDAGGGLTATMSVSFFTTDQSAGPGSSPGPTAGAAPATATGTPAAPTGATGPPAAVLDPEGT
jgi:Tfp pilus assembly protein PilO